MKKIKPTFRSPMRFDQRGMSLISVLVAMGIGGILVVVAAGLMRQMFFHAKEIDLETELSRVKTEIATGIDCKGTLDTARAQLGISQNSDLCNATRISTAQIEGYDLSGAHPLQLKLKSRRGHGRDMMGAVSATQKEASIGGGWLAQVGCDWNAKTLVVKVKRKKASLNGDSTGSRLLFGGGGLAPPLCRLELEGGPQPTPPPPPDPREEMSEVRYANTKETDYNNENFFDFEVDPKYKLVELRIHGEWEGGDDAGADTYSEQVFVDVPNGHYSGSQMVKIGSAYWKARVAVWRNTPFNPVPGDPSPVPHPLCQRIPPDHPKYNHFCNTSQDSSSTEPPPPSLQVMRSSACDIVSTSTRAWFQNRCIPDTDFARRKFPEPSLKCLDRDSSGRCVKFRYKARIVDGDDGGRHWWALSVVIRKFL